MDKVVASCSDQFSPFNESGLSPRLEACSIFEMVLMVEVVVD